MLPVAGIRGSMSDASSRGVPDVADMEAGSGDPRKQLAADDAVFKRRSSGGSGAQSQPGLRILMQNLSYHVASNKQRGERAYLLKDVSAFLEPGQMTALVRRKPPQARKNIHVLYGGIQRYINDRHR